MGNCLCEKAIKIDNSKKISCRANICHAVVLLTVALMGVLYLTGCGGRETEPHDSLVRVTAGDLSGSGVIYELDENRVIVVTAAHVLEHAENAGGVEVFFGEQDGTESFTYVKSEHADIALIEVPVGGLSQEQLAACAPVKVDKKVFDGMQPGDAVTLSGADSEAPWEGVVLEPWIYVEDFAQYMMLVQGQADAGMSGGGVFDETGCFLGIICGVSDSGEVAVLPLSIIAAVYAEHF